jgi:hypothetical protein
MMAQLAGEDVYYEFGIQVQSDPEKMPVEDPLVIWDESLSPFQRVAIIRIPKQDISDESWVEFGENLSFTPWHSLPEHRPIGSNNRARRAIYEADPRKSPCLITTPRRRPLAPKMSGVRVSHHPPRAQPCSSFDTAASARL